MSVADQPEATHCKVCSSVVGSEFAFCSRCGAPVNSPAANPRLPRVRLDSTSPTAALMTAIATGNTNEREVALSLLVWKCLEGHGGGGTAALQDEDFQVLADVVRAVKSTTYSAQLHALECLRLARADGAKFPVSDLRELRACVRDPSPRELSTLVELLQAGAGSNNNGGVVLCACVSARGNQRELWAAGAFLPLVEMLVRGNDTQKQWAAYALGNLAFDDASRLDIVRRGAVPPLVTFTAAGDGRTNQARGVRAGRGSERQQAESLGDGPGWRRHGA